MFKFFSLSQNICLNNKPGFKTKCFTGSKKLNFIGNIKSPLLKPNLKTRTKLKKTLLYKIYFSNCTFPYNYLVTTSSQSVNHLRELLIFKQKAEKPHTPLAASHLSDRDGRFVQSPSTYSPQLF